MRTQYDTLLSSGTKVEKAQCVKPMCASLAAAAVCALLVTTWLVNPKAIDSGAATVMNLVNGQDVTDSPPSRMVMYFKANDVLDQLGISAASTMTHLVVTDLDAVSDNGAEAIKERLAALQADGVAVLLAVSDEKMEQLRSDFATYHPQLNAAIVEWKADGIEMASSNPPFGCGDEKLISRNRICSTPDLMRLVASIRSDMPSDFIVTVATGAHQVFGTDHKSRQVLKSLVLKQELSDDIDWIDVHFDAAWTADLAEKIVNSMQESEYEADTIVPIMTYGEDNKDYLSLDELVEKFAASFGGFGADFSN